MEGFPGYDYPLFGNESPPEIRPLSSGDSSGSLWRTYIQVKPGGLTRAMEKTTGFLSDVGDVIASPFKSIAGTVRNTYLYLVGGIVLIGVLAILVLGASSRFMGRLE